MLSSERSITFIFASHSSHLLDRTLLKLSLFVVTHSFRILLLRRLIQTFWLLILMGLAAWGAWRFSRLASPVSAAPLPVYQSTNALQQLHIQSLATLDSSLTVLRMAVLSGKSEADLHALNEQNRQQAQEISLLMGAKTEIALIDPCLHFRELLRQKATTGQLSQHLASFQSQVRHLQFQMIENAPND